MTIQSREPAPKSVVIISGGCSGALFGMELHRARPDWRITAADFLGMGEGI